jgi:hypothetical protein
MGGGGTGLRSCSVTDFDTNSPETLTELVINILWFIDPLLSRDSVNSDRC